MFSLDEREACTLKMTFMAFSILMKSVKDTNLTKEELILFADEAWKWSHRRVLELLTELYDNTSKRAVSSENGSQGVANEAKNAPEGAGEAKTGMISEPQRKRLFAIAKKAGMSPDQLKEFLAEKFKITSTNNIHWKQYDQICKAVENGTTP